MLPLLMKGKNGIDHATNITLPSYSPFAEKASADKLVGQLISVYSLLVNCFFKVFMNLE